MGTSKLPGEPDLPDLPDLADLSDFEPTADPPTPATQLRRPLTAPSLPKPPAAAPPASRPAAPAARAPASMPPGAPPARPPPPAPPRAPPASGSLPRGPLPPGGAPGRAPPASAPRPPAASPSVPSGPHASAPRPLPTGSGQKPVAPRPPGASGAIAPASPLSHGTGHTSPSAVGIAGAQSLSQIQDYRIVRPLGRGGMAHVYLGERHDGRKAAIKLLLPQYAQDKEIVRRFMLEMKAGASLRHENVVEIIEFGDYLGNYFLASEFMDSGSVRDLMVRAGGRVPPPAAEAITVMLLRGLGAAHRMKVVHRDVKPANIMLRADGCAKLSDFGIARALDLPGLTQTGFLMGTPAYMSPEQAQGLHIDHRSDLFSAGTVLFELLTGFNPFSGANEAASIVKVISGDVPLLFEVSPALPPHLDAILTKLFARDPAHRYQSADEALADFERSSPAVYADPGKAVRDSLGDPASAMAKWRTEEARRRHERAVSLLSEGAARRPLAILELFRAHVLAPNQTSAEDRLRELFQGRDPFAPPQNPKIAELEAELQKQPNNHALLMQLAALHRMELSLVRAIGCFKRALRLRPDDGYAAGQLRSLIGEEADASLAAGHLTLKTLPPKAAPAPATSPSVPVAKAPPLAGEVYKPPAPPNSLRARAPSIVLTALALGLVAFGVRGIGRFISHAQDESTKSADALSRGVAAQNAAVDTAPQIQQKAAELRARGEAAFQAAARLARANDQGAEAALVGFREEHPKGANAVEATWLLAGLFMKETRFSSAEDELRRFLRDAPADERVPQARWMLAQAIEGRGDADGALGELNALVLEHPGSAVVTAAMCRQGELLEKKGDVATARARYEQVRGRTGPSDPLYQQATDALARLDGAPAPAPDP